MGRIPAAPCVCTLPLSDITDMRNSFVISQLERLCSCDTSDNIYI